MLLCPDVKNLLAQHLSVHAFPEGPVLSTPIVLSSVLSVPRHLCHERARRGKVYHRLLQPKSGRRRTQGNKFSCVHTRRPRPERRPTPSTSSGTKSKRERERERLPLQSLQTLALIPKRSHLQWLERNSNCLHCRVSSSLDVSKRRKILKQSLSCCVPHLRRISKIRNLLLGFPALGQL